MFGLKSFLDLPDHTLTTIATWTEVGILGFMLYERYGPKRSAESSSDEVDSIERETRFGKLWRLLVDNRTLVLAALGLGFIAWLNLRPTAVPTQSPSGLAGGISSPRSGGASLTSPPSGGASLPPAGPAGGKSPPSSGSQEGTAAFASIGLQFNSDAYQPVEVRNSNMESWNLIKVPVATAKECPASGSLLDPVTIRHPECLGSVTGGIPSLTMPRKYVETANNWLLVLQFKKPVSYRTLKFDAHGAGLPDWELVNHSRNSAVVLFKDDLPAMVLDLKTAG